MNKLEQKQQLIKQVIIEATNLKKFATEKELSRLCFRTLNSLKVNECIYGQATGYCHSMRAMTLIEKCAERIYSIKGSDDFWGDNNNELEGKPLRYLLPYLEGAPKGLRKGLFQIHYFSPIEVFINFEKNMRNGNNQNLIDYLQGETVELKLTENF